jgi:hypothetical protein
MLWPEFPNQKDVLDGKLVFVQLIRLLENKEYAVFPSLLFLAC